MQVTLTLSINAAVGARPFAISGKFATHNVASAELKNRNTELSILALDFSVRIPVHRNLLEDRIATGPRTGIVSAVFAPRRRKNSVAFCARGLSFIQEEFVMKIAVCCTPGGSTLGPFGRGSEVSIWDVEGKAVMNRQLVPQQGGCCGGLARSVLGVDVVLCAGIGQGALNHLVEQHTPVAMPVEGSADAEAAVRLWLSGAYDRFNATAGECGHPGGSCGAGEHGHHAH